MMLNPDGALAVKNPPGELPMEAIVVDTKFGTFEFMPEQTIMMPHGLIGFSDSKRFGLGNLPGPALESFKLLQSLDDLLLSFIVMPISSDPSLIAAEDLEGACNAVGFLKDDVQLMCLCTVRPKADGDGIDMWINLMAPVLFDLKAQQAYQHVLPNNRYPLRQSLDNWTGKL